MQMNVSLITQLQEVQNKQTNGIMSEYLNFIYHIVKKTKMHLMTASVNILSKSLLIFL